MLKYIGGYPDGSFKPTANITRAEIVKILDNIFKGVYLTAGSCTGDVAGNAVVSAANSTLKDMKIACDLIIAEGVGNGDVNLDNVTVDTILVRGGGSNSIHLKDCKASNVVIERADGSVRLSAEGKTVITNVEVLSTKAKVESEKGTLIKDIVVNAEDATVNAEGKVETVAVNGDNADVSANGAKVTVGDSATGTKVDGKDAKPGETLDSNGGNTSSGSGSSSGGTPSTPTKYTVTFDKDGNGNADVETIKVVNGNKVKKPDNPSQEGCEFDGWKYEKGEILIPFDFNTPITKNITLYASWSVKLNTPTAVSINDEAEISVKNGEEVTNQGCSSHRFVLTNSVRKIKVFFSDLVQNAYKFIGGFKSDSISVTTVASSTDIAYEMDESDKCSKDISFNVEETGEALVGVKASKSEKDDNYQYTYSLSNLETNNTYVVVLNNKFSKQEYKITAKNETVDFKGFINATSFAISKITSISKNGYTMTPFTAFTPFGEATKESCIVKFDVNDGSYVQQQSIAKDGLVEKPAEPTREGYDFGGWYKDTETKNAWDFEKNVVTEPITLYAKWIESTPNLFEVTYTLGEHAKVGAEVPKAIKVTEGSSVSSLPNAPDAAEGYVFDKWTNEDGTKFTPDTKVTDNITVTATFRKITNAEKLATDLGIDNSSVRDDTVTLRGDVDVNNNVTVPNSVTLTVADEATLTVEDEATLTVEDGATFEVAGNFVNNGKIDVKGILNFTAETGSFKPADRTYASGDLMTDGKDFKAVDGVLYLLKSSVEKGTKIPSGNLGADVEAIELKMYNSKNEEVSLKLTDDAPNTYFQIGEGAKWEAHGNNSDLTFWINHKTYDNKLTTVVGHTDSGWVKAQVKIVDALPSAMA